jgi:hypothetical protein
MNMIANSSAMSDQFIPLAPLSSSSKDTAFSSLSLKVLSKGAVAGRPAFDTLAAASVDMNSACSPEACKKPTVTLQRRGDAVSGIRIQCGCGEVIELTCLH